MRAVDAFRRRSRGTITEIDRMVRALREDGDDPPPANPAALEDLFEQHRISGLDITAHTHGTPPVMSRSVAWATYRILQEALTNAARHGTGSAEVALCFDPSAVEISVTNPTATAPAQHRLGGHGIVGMRERAVLLGGTLQAAAGCGTFRVQARLPCSEPSA